MRTRLLIAMAALAAAGCATAAPQDAAVTISQGVCVVSPTGLKVGDVTFHVRNTTNVRTPFIVSEDDGTKKVGEVDVNAGAVDTLTVHLDGGDKYQLTCGATPGPEIDPGA